MLPRIVKSAGVQTAFLGLVSAVLLAASDGKLEASQVNHIIDLFMTYVLPAVIVKFGFEDGMKNLGIKKEEATPTEWTKVP